MKLKTLLLSGCLLSWLVYSCEDTGPGPIDMPDPTDTMPVDTMPMDTMPMDTMPMDTMPIDTMPIDTMPMDTMPTVDTTGTFLINEIKGNYLGYCYNHTASTYGIFDDTLYNVTITIDSLERLQVNGVYYYVLTDGALLKFFIPEAEFAQDTIFIHDNGSIQTVQKSFLFIRSRRFLISNLIVLPADGFTQRRCYCYKQ